MSMTTVILPGEQVVLAQNVGASSELSPQSLSPSHNQRRDRHRLLLPHFTFPGSHVEGAEKWNLTWYCEPPPPFNNSCQCIRDYKADHLCQQGELLNALGISGSMVQGWASALVEFPTVVRKPAAGCSGREEQGTGLVLLGLPHPVEGLVNLLITVFYV